MVFKSIRRKTAVGFLGAAMTVAIAAAPAGLRAQAPQDQDSRPRGMEVLPPNGGGWAGIGIEEVSADRVKALKLPGEYGAYVAEVADNSPAAKAGIKQGDVITEYDGQRVEGAVELRRLVRETPPGRAAEMTVWRDGKSQKLRVEVAARPNDSGAQNGREFGFAPPPPNFGSGPQGGGDRFGYRGAPEMPQMPFDGNGKGERRALMAPPALGVSAQDLSGQLGNYFGAPDGEGVLVTDVPANSPGGKAGLKAGDVISEVDGVRVRNVGELRDHLRDKQRDNESVKLDVIRKGATVSVSVQLEKPPAPPNRGDATGRSTPL